MKYHPKQQQNHRITDAYRSKYRKQIIANYRANNFVSSLTQNQSKCILNQIINDEGVMSYIQHKDKIQGYLRSPQFLSQQMDALFIQLAPTIYEYMFIHQFQKDEKSIEILKYISCFPNICLPQTNQLACWLNESLKSLKPIQINNSLHITANLLINPKYQKILKQKLDNCQYFTTLTNLISEQFSSIFYSSFPESNMFCCEIFMVLLTTATLPSCSKLVKFLSIAIKVSRYDERSKWAIMRELGNMNYRTYYTQNMNQYCEVLLEYCTQFILSQNYGFQSDFLSFVVFCLKNNSIIQTILSISKRSIKWEPENLSLLLQCLQLYIQQQIIDPCFISVIETCFLAIKYQIFSEPLLAILCQISLSKPQLVYKYSAQSIWNRLLDKILQTLTKQHQNMNRIELCCEFVKYCVQYEDEQQIYKKEEFSFINWLNIMGGKQAIQNLDIKHKQSQNIHNILDVLIKY